MKLGSYEDPNITRQVVLKMEFDGKETVWCPIGDFFGSGIGLNPLQGWYNTVAEDGTMSCRWVMPYQKGGKVSLVNFSSKPVDAELIVKTGDWKRDYRSMYFHAGWRGQYPVKTRPRSDWNYVTLKGRGVYVGDTLTIMNPECNGGVKAMRISGSTGKISPPFSAPAPRTIMPIPGVVKTRIFMSILWMPSR